MWYAESVPADQPADAAILQTLTLPAGLSAPTLAFSYHLSGVLMGQSPLEARIDDGVAVTTVFSAGTTTPGWTPAWVDLTPWLGLQVTLSFNHHQAAGLPYTWALLDEVSAGSAFPDLWATKAASAPFAAPGAAVQFTLSAGNRGGAGTYQVVVTDTLPVELQFVSADPPPTTIAPYLTWALGDLPPGRGPVTITLLTTVAPSAPPWGTLTNRVDIGSASPELETLNNQAEAQIWIGWRIILPIALRAW